MMHLKISENEEKGKIQSSRWKEKKIKIKAAIDEMEINRTIHRRRQIEK